MENNIQKYNYSIDNNFSEKEFFKNILECCYEKKLLDDNILANIYYERMELLKIKLKYYIKDESSSVMVEVAENILQCIDYTIGIYLKTFENIEIIVQQLKDTSLSDMLKKGHNLIKKKIVDSKKLLQEINENKLEVRNYSYKDTIGHGIPLFFKEYNDFFAAHETPGSIDYQLYIDNMNYIGIEYIYNYLENLSLENEFCYRFDNNEINKLLDGYDKKCEELLINIFELVLINSLGRIICRKDLNSLNINRLDRNHIKNKLEKLSLKQIQEELVRDVKICCEILDIKNVALVEYMKKATLKIAFLINERMKINRLEAVFISFNDDNSDEIIQYIDGEKIDNPKFKKLSEKIRECSLVQEKIILIKNNIKSLEDLVDMLNSDCLFEEEYIMYFKSLSKIEIALLSKYIFENGYENELCFEFNMYCTSLSQEEQKKIRELKDKIQFYKN